MQLCRDIFFFQAEDGIRDLVRSRGLGDVYKRQAVGDHAEVVDVHPGGTAVLFEHGHHAFAQLQVGLCLLYTSDAADERSSVDLGGRRIIQKKKKKKKKKKRET